MTGTLPVWDTRRVAVAAHVHSPDDLPVTKKFTSSSSRQREQCSAAAWHHAQ